MMNEAGYPWKQFYQSVTVDTDALGSTAMAGFLKDGIQNWEDRRRLDLSVTVFGKE